MGLNIQGKLLVLSNSYSSGVGTIIIPLLKTEEMEAQRVENIARVVMIQWRLGFKNSIGNVEAKELISMTHRHEL